MIVSGEKKEEYREIKPYWKVRLENEMNETNFMLFQKGLSARIERMFIRNGYGDDRPTAKISVTVIKGYGNPDWGAEPGKEYFVLKILSVKELKKR